MRISPDTPFQLVHVGKCGGSSAVQELRLRGYDFEHVHMRRPVASPNCRYVILVRDPVARFVSAFNWRYHLLGEDLLPAAFKQDPLARIKQQAEWSFLSFFQDVNEFAERLVRSGPYDVSAMTSMMALITHVSEGFSWYLDDLLDQVAPSQLVGVIATEHFTVDFEKLFGFQPQAERNRHYPRRRQELSPLGRTNLVRELASEYRTLEKLAVMARQAGVPMSLTYEEA